MEKREIKFRAWSDITKTMSPNAMTISVWIEFWAENADKMLLRLSLSQITWLAWTGLKDKNGKEIYEGDIMQFEWDDEANITEQSMRFEVKCHNMGNVEPYDMVRGKVIGNIYENPKLLK
jgi:hypothetical protein